MLTFGHPWLLWLAPLPLLVWWLAPPHRERRRGLVVPFLERLAHDSHQRPAGGAVVRQRGVVRWLLLWACWGCVLVAAARPQVIEPPITKEIPVRDLLLAVDLSGSMETKDFENQKGETVDRLAAVKEVLDDFLEKRKGDRVGLIFFGTAPFVQAPFTQDLDVVRSLLDEAQVKMAGPQTAFGDALGLAIDMFERSTVQQRVLIALTDGNDTSSRVPPVKAAQIAKDKGIVIHTVAVGDPRAAGEDALDVAALRGVAEATGGLCGQAADREQLAAIYQRLDQLERQKARTVSHRPRRDVYWWPLAAVLVASMLQLAWGLVRGRVPAAEALPAAPVPAPAASLAAAVPLVAFQFIRPAWLLLAVPAIALWWLLRRDADATRAWRGIVAPHLLPHLLRGEHRVSRAGPPEWIALGWLLTIVAVAGPTWRHEPSPFADDAAALAIVVRVSPSMTTEDVQPSRLARATQKVHDLLAQRGLAKTALIAYAGSAHVVMPATTDSGIIDTFAGALDPKIMPVDGDVAADALALADRTLASAGGGSILWVTDGVSPEQAPALSRWREQSETTVRLWPPLLPGAELDSLRENARGVDARFVRLSADDSDVDEIASAAKFADTSTEGTGGRWAESGYWLTPVLAAMVLVLFRRGWLAASGEGR
jgi:Ca-activated chloride channel family protein